MRDRAGDTFMDDLLSDLQSLHDGLDRVVSQLDTEALTSRALEIEKLSGAPDFWHDDTSAKTLMQELAGIREDLENIQSLGKGIEDQRVMVEMLKETPDADFEQAVRADVANLVRQFAALETKLFLSGEYDASSALISIHAGQGGVDAQDWAGMVARMYQRYVERQGWSYEVLDESTAEEAGIKSMTILVKGRYAYGYLKHEQGTHRLVRLSPFNADNLRQTSFALVEVLPEIEASKQIDIPDSDLEWSFFRSSGKGGQNVNKVSTAVRLKHLPSGIVVESQAQRTQVQNRSLALGLLQAKLWAKEQEATAKELAALKGGTQASWGTQIRSYVLHPYQLVKDTRTEVETSDTAGVLDGDLDMFVQAELRLSLQV